MVNTGPSIMFVGGKTMLINDKPGEYSVISLKDLTASKYIPEYFITGKNNVADLMTTFRGPNNEIMCVYLVRVK